MRNLLLTLTVVMALCLTANVALADPVPAFDAAPALVTVTVDEVIEWAAANFATIEIANITNQGDKPEASQSLVLYTNCDLTITADHTAAAQLTKTTDTLVTEYKLVYDHTATAPDTGGATVDWTDYATFIPVGSAVTHNTLDGAVSVELSARASNAAGTLADAGAYTATQTLTATF